MSYNNPSVQEFKDYFARDFPFGTDPAISVTDSDILRAFLSTNITINSAFFSEQSAYTIGYLNLSAHNLVIALRNSSGGINAQFAFPSQSRSVGNVSESFAIPQQFLDNPAWSYYFGSSYGSLYLQMILPYLVAPVSIAHGRTLP